MASRLPALLKKFGYIEGFRIYNHIKSKSNAAIKIPGLKHPLYFRGRPDSTDAFIFEQIFIENQYDVPVPFEPGVIFDLGANVGLASVLYANLYPGARIIALEPDNGNFEAATKNLSPYTNVTLVKGAIWNKSENINLVDEGFGEAAYMVKPGEGKNMVRGYTIPELMQLYKIPGIDLLKIDVEGAEKEIFETNPEQWIPYCKMIIVETHDRYKKNSSTSVFNAIGQYDFSLELKGENLILYNNELTNPYA